MISVALDKIQADIHKDSMKTSDTSDSNDESEWIDNKHAKKSGARKKKQRSAESHESVRKDQVIQTIYSGKSKIDV